MKELFSIGIPVKNELGSILELRRQVTSLINLEKYYNLEFEIIINDNVSTDGSTALLLDWEASEKNVMLYVLDTPLDFQSTVRDLMCKANGKGFALLQSDMQDPIEVLQEMLDIWLNHPERIVAGKITKRKEPTIVSISRKFFYFLLDVSSDKMYVNGFQDFYILPKYVYDQIIKLPPQNLFIRGFLNYSFTELIYVDYKREPRKAGKSKFNFTSMYDLALDGLLLYGRNFIRLISILSFFVFSISSVGSFLLICTWLLGYNPGVRGWMSIALGILLTLSFLGLVVGIILEYLIRIYRRLQLTQQS
jgi:glycosyltransferase involved in cell wall biosynthesis